MKCMVARVSVGLIGGMFLAAVAAQTPLVAPSEGVGYPSGFLPDYSLLKPVPGKEGRYAWTAPDAELRAYSKFILAPLSIWIDPDAQYRGLAACLSGSEDHAAPRTP